MHGEPRHDRGLDDRRVERVEGATEQAENPADVVARLGIRGNAAVPIDRPFSRVVCGGDERDLTAVIREQPT
jgi:hypothetical protein